MAEYVDASPEQQAQALSGAVNVQYLEVVLLYKPPGAGPAPPAPPHALVLEVGRFAGLTGLRMQCHEQRRPGRRAERAAQSPLQSSLRVMGCRTCMPAACAAAVPAARMRVT